MAPAEATGMDTYTEHCARLRASADVLTRRLAALARSVEAADARIAALAATPADGAALAAIWTSTRTELQTKIAALAERARAALDASIRDLTDSSQSYFVSSAARLGHQAGDERAQ
jgi:hypothetical protein